MAETVTDKRETWTLKPGQEWPFRWVIEGDGGREVVSGYMAHYSTEDKTIYDVIARDPEANGGRMRDLNLITQAPGLRAALDQIARLTPHDDVTEAINIARAALR